MATRNITIVISQKGVECGGEICRRREAYDTFHEKRVSFPEYG